MSEFEVGDIVKLKDDLVIGRRYSGLTFLKGMKDDFLNNRKIKNISINSVEVEGLYYSYKTDMIEHATKTNENKRSESKMENVKVTFNEPATILYNEDTDKKVVVKTTKNDKYDPIVGFLYGYFEMNSGMTKTQCGKFFDKLEKEYQRQIEAKKVKKSKKLKNTK